jgi:hypothetical protein
MQPVNGEAGECVTCFVGKTLVDHECLDLAMSAA